MNEPTHTSQESLLERCTDSTPTDRHNIRRFLWMTATWGVVFVAATWALKHQVVPAGPLAWLVAIVPTLLGVLVCVSYVRYLRQADELQRATQLQALAFGFGTVWLALSGYPLLERLGAPSLSASDYAVIMAVSFSLANVIGLRRYR